MFQQKLMKYVVLFVLLQHLDCKREIQIEERSETVTNGLPDNWRILGLTDADISRIIRNDDEGIEFQVKTLTHQGVKKKVHEALGEVGYKQYCSEFGNKVRGYAKDRKYIVVTFEHYDPPIIQAFDNTLLQAETKPSYDKCFVGFSDLKIKKVYDSREER